MRRLGLGALVWAVLSVTLGANYYAFEQITVDSTAGGKGFTAATITPAGRPVMTWADCTVRTASISYLVVDPAVTAVTASVGQVANIGDRIVITSRELILNFRAIRTGATSGQLDCWYMAVN